MCVVKLLRVLLAAPFLLAIAAFCGFGFMATFEPTDKVAQFMAFRVGYALVGASCLVGVLLLVADALKGTDRDAD